MTSTWHRHAWNNRLQSALLIGTMLALSVLLGQMLIGTEGIWITLSACLVALALEPAASSRLTLRLYRARPIPEAAAPRLWATVRTLTANAGLPAVPSLYYVPSPVANAFAVGSRRSAAIALSDGLLRRLSQRELAGVMAHEIAHIARDDLRVMGLADYLSRLTHLLSLLGTLVLLATLPMVVWHQVVIEWAGLLLLIVAPQLTLLAQMGLSRVREFDADLVAVSITGDPEGLAAALMHIDQTSRGLRALLFPGLGNPEPSWLRTHPATHERVRRLMELQAADVELAPDRQAPHWLPPHPPRSRYRAGGVWF